MSTQPNQPPSSAPLPEGWERIAPTPSGGLLHWVNREQRITTYYDPRLPNPHTQGFKAIPLEGPPLPSGWEIVGRESDGEIAYLDHNMHTSTHIDPRGGDGSGNGGEGL
jgi:hypothetical protein